LTPKELKSFFLISAAALQAGLAPLQHQAEVAEQDGRDGGRLRQGVHFINVFEPDIPAEVQIS
jgi:hypothetical protein